VAYVNAQAVYLGADTALCSGSSLTLAANVPNAQYQWSTGASGVSVAVTQTGMYWLRVTNGGCTVADTVQVTFSPPPVFSLGADTTLCDGQGLKLFSGVSGVQQWSDGSSGDTLRVTQAGWHWLTVTKNGCAVRDSILVSYKRLPVVNLGMDTSICAGTTFLLSAAHPSVERYQWQDGSAQASYTVSQPGNYSVKVKGYNGCYNSDGISVSSKPLPNFSLGTDTTLCTGQSLTYQFSQAGASYLWSDNSRFGSNRFNHPGLYWLEIVQKGCKKRDSVNLAYKPLPVVNLGPDTTICEGTFYQLSAMNAGASYAWNTGARTPGQIVSKPGLYWANVNLNGCAAADSVLIAFRYLPKFSLGADTSLCSGQSFRLAPQAGLGQYVWNDGSTATAYTVTQPGTFSLTITNSCGTASDAITVTKGVCQLYMPNAFTPDNNGKNDNFRVKYPQFIKTFRMQVFNRWGEIVYNSTDPYKGWDGRNKGVWQPADAYVWMIALTDLDGKQGVYKGTVLLVR
jgi:gliding motility-associated-like protein